MMNYNGSRFLQIGGIVYLLIISVITLIVFGVDKNCARQHAWRIPEKVLFLLAALGGSIGAIIGMLAFRHKTKKWHFRIGMPLILILQVVIILVIKAVLY